MDEWPPAEARVRAAIWRAEGHLERGEYYAASRALAAVLEIAGDAADLVKGLHHLAAAGYRARIGDRERARRQLERARRRLERAAPTAHDVDIEALIAVVEAELGS